MRKGCTSCCSQANSQRQKTSEETAAMCCFLKFASNLVISRMRWKMKILTSRVQALEFTNEEERQAHQQAIEEKDATIALLNDDLKNREHIMWHCRHRGRSIRTSYKNVKTSLPILGHVMFLMQKIQAKITLL